MQKRSLSDRNVLVEKMASLQQEYNKVIDQLERKSCVEQQLQETRLKMDILQDQLTIKNSEFEQQQMQLELLRQQNRSLSQEKNKLEGKLETQKKVFDQVGNMGKYEELKEEFHFKIQQNALLNEQISQLKATSNDSDKSQLLKQIVELQSQITNLEIGKLQKESENHKPENGQESKPKSSQTDRSAAQKKPMEESKDPQSVRQENVLSKLSDESMEKL